MARPSEVCEYCPTADSIEFPTNTNDWTNDYIPRWIKLALPYWKGKRGTRMWYFYLNRNYVDPRFCPVSFMMMWLRASGIKKDPHKPSLHLIFIYNSVIPKKKGILLQYSILKN